MPTYLIEIGQEPFRIDVPVVPGAPFELEFENPDNDDWSAVELKCDVRDLDDNLIFSVRSNDNEITVDSENVITMTWPMSKTALLAKYTRYKFDMIIPSSKQVVWAITRITTSERVTE